MSRSFPLRSGHLEALVPGLAATCPRLAVATLPTPLEPFPDLAARFGLASLHVKRDDRTSPLYGGTKVRGLEFFLGRAAARGCTRVVTLGSAGSNHAVATATFAREVGIGSRAVLFPFPDRAYADSNVARLLRLGAVVRRTGWFGLLPEIAYARWGWMASRSLWIAPGGSSALGVLGAAEGALEVVAATRAEGRPLPDLVVVAAGSCGTAAGLALGFMLAAAPVRVVAVRVVPRLIASDGKIARLVKDGVAALRSAGFADSREPPAVEFVHGQAGEGYGLATGASRDAVGIAGAAGIRAETTYTGKAWAHLFSGNFVGKRAVFWNTFGG